MSKYGVFLVRFESEYGKIRTKKKSVFGHFPNSEYLLKIFSAHVVHDDDKKLVKKSN